MHGYVDCFVCSYPSPAGWNHKAFNETEGKKGILKAVV